MGGPGDSPDGAPEGAPGGDEEYRSVVFDESFVRAARLQESSARERIGDHAPAVRRRPPLHRALSRQVLILVLLIVVAFGTAIYMGVTAPGGPSARQRVEPLRMTVIPLAPRHRVPGAARPGALFAASPAAEFRTGSAGITLPAGRRTPHFSESQVMSALVTAKDYLVASSLDTDVLAGRTVRPVRLMVDGRQLDQFDAGLREPAADGRHAPTGWLTRFDPTTALAVPEIRVQGTLRAAEGDATTLEVDSDHTFVYALRPADGGPHAAASLFTVRRALHFRFDRDDLRLHQAQVAASSVQAGPLTCSADAAGTLHPLLAGQSATGGGPAGATDPYATGAATALCGTLADRAQPAPRHGAPASASP